MNNHLFFEYSSEEEEIADINKLQEEFESDNTVSSTNESVDSDEVNETFGLKLEDIFDDWDSVEKHVVNYATKAGFEVVKRRFEKNKNGIIVRRTFECKNSHEHHVKRKADIENNRERRSVKTKCPWRVNFNLLNGIIRITSIYEEHNHPLIENIQNVVPKFHRLSPEMLEEVEFLVNIGCGAGSIIRGLKKRFPDAIIYPKNVYEAINLFRHNKTKKTDAAITYDKLIQMQRKEHGWFVEARVEGEDNHLTGLFWMRPSQIDLWERFHDVVINDNTSKTNQYQMYLSLTIVVDNHGRSRMVATAVVSDETKETYQWILECLLHATNGLAPKVLFTDADAGMIAAIHETLPETKHNYCIWHIRKNLEKNLKGKLGNIYIDFIKAWNKCRNSFSESEFHKQWNDLLANFPIAKGYLERVLGTNVTSWALCYTHQSFNAGIQSTQRVESYNALIKKSVSRNTTLFELDIQIQLQLDKEEQFERQEEQIEQNPTIGLPNIIDRYFKQINNIIKKYLTPRILKIQHQQINESLLYRIRRIENWQDLLKV